MNVRLIRNGSTGRNGVPGEERPVCHHCRAAGVVAMIAGDYFGFPDSGHSSHPEPSILAGNVQNNADTRQVDTSDIGGCRGIL
jgi:hypothetical protein